MKAHSGITRSAVRGGYWVLIGTLARQGLQLIALAILARLLAPNDFGLVGAGLIVVGISMTLYQLGVGPAVVQRKNLSQDEVKAAFWLSIAFSILMAAVVWALAPVASQFFRMPDLPPLLRAMSLSFPLAGVGVVAESLMQRELRFRALATAEILGYLIGYAALGIALALLGAGVWALVGAQVGLILVRSSTFLVCRPHSFSPRFTRQSLRALLGFGMGNTVGRLGEYVAIQAENAIVGRYLGTSALGVYGRAYQFLTVPVRLFGTALDKVLFPSMAVIQQDLPRLARGYRRSAAALALVTLPTSAVLIAVAPEVVHVLLGAGWEAVIVPFQILVSGLIVRAGAKVADSVTRAAGQVYGYAWRQIVYGVLVVLGAIAGLPWGLNGVAVGATLAATFNYVSMAQFAVQVSGASFLDAVRAHIPAICTAILVGASALIIAHLGRENHLPPGVIVVAAIFASGVLALLAWKHARSVFLGPDGTWLMQSLRDHSPSKLQWLFPV